MNKEEIKQLNWEEELFELSEKYCQHDKFPCLIHILTPFIERTLEAQREDLLKKITKKQRGVPLMLPFKLRS